MLVKDIKSYLISWNNLFPLDKTFRDKNNIRFNSREHRESCQIDIYLDYLEEKLYKDHYEGLMEKSRKAELYKKGIWLEEIKIDADALTAIFDNIDIDSLID